MKSAKKKARPPKIAAFFWLEIHPRELQVLLWARLGQGISTNEEREEEGQASKNSSILLA